VAIQMQSSDPWGADIASEATTSCAGLHSQQKCINRSQTDQLDVIFLTAYIVDAM